eukprot:GCRY01002899.1.p1 GENE.GCRY01002899.1~~GCRY01002899.1.p1  ORF type:complete len:180 (-),score=32.99 GCRY01002899.1:36-575(-)
MGKKCFITVGTTKFEKLLRAIDSEHFLKFLVENHFSALSIQLGRGEYIPFDDEKLNSEISETSLQKDGISINLYRLKPSLKEDFESSDLIISHAGAGTILEALHFGVPIFVVLNEDLMDNHQTELATLLSAEKHLFSSTPAALVQALRQHFGTQTVPFPPPSGRERFVSDLQSLLHLKS